MVEFLFQKAAQQRLAPAVVSEKVSQQLKMFKSYPLVQTCNERPHTLQVPPQPGPGSAVVGETVVVTPITASGGDGDDTLDELPTDLPEVAASPPPPKPLSPIPTRITDARSPSRTVTVVSRQIVPKRFACRFLGLLPTTAVNLGPYRGPLSKAGSVPVWSGDGELVLLCGGLLSFEFSGSFSSLGPSNKSQQVVFRMPSVPSACSSILPTLGSSVDKVRVYFSSMP